VSEAIEFAAEHMDVNVREYLYESAATDREADRGTKTREGAIAPR
jgi:hypothetical protein